MVFVILLYFASIISLGVVFLLTGHGKIDIQVLDHLEDKALLNTIAYVAFAIAGISLLVLLCSIRKIKIGIMVIKTTAEFTQQ